MFYKQAVILTPHPSRLTPHPSSLTPRQVVKKRLGFNEPSIGVGDSVMWEEGEGADTDDFVVNLPKVTRARAFAFVLGRVRPRVLVRVRPRARARA